MGIPKSEFFGSAPKSNPESNVLTLKVSLSGQEVTFGVTFVVTLGETLKVTF